MGTKPCVKKCVPRIYGLKNSHIRDALEVRTSYPEDHPVEPQALFGEKYFLRKLPSSHPFSLNCTSLLLIKGLFFRRKNCYFNDLIYYFNDNNVMPFLEFKAD